MLVGMRRGYFLWVNDSYNYTMLYYHADEVIPEYKSLPNDLF